MTMKRKKPEVQTEYYSLDEIYPNPDNPRRISDDQLAKLARNIEKNPKLFDSRPILVNQDGMIIGGNSRYHASKALGLKEVPVDKVNWTEKEQKDAIVLDNAAFGSWIKHVLIDQYDAGDLIEMGIDQFDFDDGVEVRREIDESDLEPQKAKTTKIKTGDIIHIGEHRLLCGDSTDTKAIAKLFNGDQAEMTFTDPPYLMDFKGTGGKGTEPDIKIENDNLDATEAGIFLAKIAQTIKKFSTGAWYVCFYRLKLEWIINALNQNGLKYKAVIIWHKNNFNMSGSDYQNTYEPIIYGWNKEHNYYGGRSQVDVMRAKKTDGKDPNITTQGRAVYLKAGEAYYKFERITKKPQNVIEIKDGETATFNLFTGENDIWEVDKSKTNNLHPTMKPLELCQRAIRNSSKPGQIVFDPFLGSGSTMVSAHKLMRKCYGVEMDPLHCQTIIDRMLINDPELKAITQ